MGRAASPESGEVGPSVSAPDSGDLVESRGAPVASTAWVLRLCLVHSLMQCSSRHPLPCALTAASHPPSVLAAAAGRLVVMTQASPHRAAPPSPPHLLCSSIPVRFKPGVPGPDGVEVLLISSRRGKGDVFPKGGWEVRLTQGQAWASAYCREHCVCMAAPFRPASPRQHPSAGCLCATLKALLLPLVLQVDEELREAAQRETVEEAGVRGELEVRTRGACRVQHTGAAPLSRQSGTPGWRM